LAAVARYDTLGCACLLAILVSKLKQGIFQFDIDENFVRLTYP